MKPFLDNPEAYRERMACFANAQDAWIADCGHNIHHDQPAALAGLLDDFLT